MQIQKTLALLIVMVVGYNQTRADFITEFAGYETINEVGVSGLTSSYYTDSTGGVPLSGPTISTTLATLGPDRVTYPYNIGQVPSPGGSVGKYFDQGALGIKIEGDQLTVKLATGLDPQAGYYYNGWRTWYGQGDLFISVADSEGVSHYALLSAWARDESNTPRSLNGGHFADARSFHTEGAADGGSLEGHLVALQQDSDISVSGGTGAYTSGNAPGGLDRRVFASGGTDLADAALLNGMFSDGGQQWYTQSWTFRLGNLSSDDSFAIGMHAAPTCGNDQIAGNFVIPEPVALALLVAGSFIMLRRRL